MYALKIRARTLRFRLRQASQRGGVLLEVQRGGRVVRSRDETQSPRCGVDVDAVVSREDAKCGILNDSSDPRVPRVTMGLTLNRAVVSAVALIGLLGVARAQPRGGGTLEIKSAAGQGTMWSLRMPTESRPLDLPD
jgi:hypothetical protein